jgi:hypothetical protein
MVIAVSQNDRQDDCCLPLKPVIPRSHALRGNERRKKLKSGKQGLTRFPAINSEVFFKKKHLFLSDTWPAPDNLVV